MSISLSQPENRHWGGETDRIESETRSGKSSLSSSVVIALLMLCFLGYSEKKHKSSAPDNRSNERTEKRQNHSASDERDRRAESLVFFEYEVPGLSPEEVEKLVTSHVETAIDGSDGLVRLESVSRTGQAVFWAWFDRSVVLSQARTAIVKRLLSITKQLPDNKILKLPLTFHRGFLIALSVDVVPATAEERNKLEAKLREFAEYNLRNHLQTIPHVSQVTVTGGLHKQFQIIVSPKRMRARNVSMEKLARAVVSTNSVPEDLYLPKRSKEFIERRGKWLSWEEIGRIVIKPKGDLPILVSDVAEVRLGWVTDPADDIMRRKQPKVGTSKPAVVMVIGLQDNADKSVVSGKIDERWSWLKEFKDDMPRNIVFQRKIDPQLDLLVSQSLRKLERNMPWNVQLVQHSSDQLGNFFSTTANDLISVKVVGSELAILRVKAEEIRKRMEKVTGVVDLQIEPNFSEKRMEWNFDRERLSKVGITLDALEEQIKLASGEKVVCRIYSDNSIYDLVIKTISPDGDLSIGDTPIRTRSGDLVPLSQLATIRLKQGPLAIYRENMKRFVLVTGRVKGRDKSDIESDVRKALSPIVMKLEDGYRIEFRNH